MLLLHTADWHLGHSLHGVDREAEHGRFLGWLLDRLEERRVDALLVCGDVFDASNPPARAQAQWFGFLAEARRRLPALQIVAIGGNHDSGARLDAPGPLLDAFGLHVRGCPRADPAAMVVPLRDASGRVAARALAVPFLRPGDLPRGEPGPDEDPAAAGLRAVYARAAEAARALAGPDEALIVLGHCHLLGGLPSEASERRLVAGGLHGLAAGALPAGATYVALGHLHLAQRVGAEHVRYAGSPLPLSLDERRYRHQVLLVELDGPRLARVEPLEVPRARALLRCPEEDALPPEELLARLAALELPPPAPAALTPLLELSVALEAPSPDLRRRIEAALEGQPVRLARLKLRYPGGTGAPSAAGLRCPLRELEPGEVLELAWRARYPGEPPEPLRRAFQALLDEVRAEGGGA